MTPREKALELIIKYELQTSIINAKKNSLICVDEIIKSTFSKKWYDSNKLIAANYLYTDFWKQVKQEIETM